MASLVTLPNEISDLIYEHLTTPDFLHLSETCEQLHTRVLPLAYKHLTLTWYNESEQIRKSPDINALSRKFRASPEIKNLVRRLTLETSKCLIRTQEGEPVVDIAGSDRADFYGGVEDVIRQCNRLERLDLSLLLVVEECFWFENLMHGIRESWTDNLKHVHLTRDGTARDDWVPNQTMIQEEFLKLLALPYAEVIELDFFAPLDVLEIDFESEVLVPEPEDFWPWAQMKVSEHLHTLRISCCPTPTVAFEVILQEASSLRVFDIEFYQHPSSYGFDLDALKGGLDAVKSTLTHLRICYDAFEEQASRDIAQMFRNTWGSLGSFRDYNALTHLEVSLHILFGTSDSSKGTFHPLSALLPPNLEMLVITDNLPDFIVEDEYFEHDHAMAMFERFFDKEWRDATPHLKEFTHDLRESGSRTFDYWDKQEKSKDLMSLCERQGIAGKVLRKS
jgi:hypothetical protein